MKHDLDPQFGEMRNQIDRGSPVPIYYQISEAILEIINRERLAPHAKLPPEEKLAQIFHVSKMTIRQAYAKLVNDGVLTRRKGSGTFLAETKIERKATKLVSFYDDLGEKGFTVGSKIIEEKIILAKTSLMRRLELKKDSRVYKIIRLRFADQSPLAVNYAYIPEKVCPDLMDADLSDRSLSSLIEEQYDIVLKYAVQNIQAVKATSFEANLLEIKTGDPILFMERTHFDENERPVSYYVNYIRGDKYVFNSILYR